MHTLYFDGASRGNPGPAGAGGVIYDASGKEVDCYSLSMGKTTNNVAEYGAMLAGLNRCRELNIQELAVFGDSNLVINQMKRKWKVKSANLQPIYTQAQEVAQYFTSISYTHVYRKDNKRADTMANLGIDGAN